MFTGLEHFELSNAILSDASIKNYLASIANRVNVFEAKNCQLSSQPN
jgi:hypothetical protein